MKNQLELERLYSGAMSALEDSVRAGCTKDIAAATEAVTDVTQRIMNELGMVPAALKLYNAQWRLDQ